MTRSAQWRDLSDLEVALLCRLHYLARGSVEALGSDISQGQGLERVLAEKLAAEPRTAIHEALLHLDAAGLTCCAGEQWRLTDRGRPLAYNLCELEIQRQSGVWATIAATLGIHGPFRSMLDIGCSGGMSAIPGSEAGLLSENSRYIGLDVDQRGLHAGLDLLAQFSGTAPSVTLIAGDARRLPIADSSVECVISRATLYYLKKRPVLAEMVRSLTPGGYLIVTVPTLDYMAGKFLEGVMALNFRQAVVHAIAVILGLFAWLGFDVSPPRGCFIGETRRGLASRMKHVPEMKLLRLAPISLPMLGKPLLLVARKGAR